MARVRVQVPVDDDEIDQAETKTEAIPVAQEEKPGQKRSHRQTVAKVLPKIRRNPTNAAALIVIILLGVFIIFLVKDRTRLKQEVSRLSQIQTQPAPNQEAQLLKKEVSQFIELPTDELPTVATVVDANKVRKQPFFKSAQNGDKVLLFARAGKAILYRPSTKKVIEVAPINLGDSQNTAD